MDELSNSVKNRNNKNIKHPKNNGFMQQESSRANKNFLMLKHYVDQGYFRKRNKVVSEWSDNRYKLILDEQGFFCLFNVDLVKICIIRKSK